MAHPTFLHPSMPEPSIHRNAGSARSFMRRGTLGVLAFRLAVMAMLYEQRQRDRMVLRPHR